MIPGRMMVPGGMMVLEAITAKIPAEPVLLS
jgi:hypothetical protein